MNDQVLPIFRSPEQARLLTELFVYAEEPLSLTQLAQRIEVSQPGVHKEVDRLEKAGLVESRRVGRTRLVSAAMRSPFYAELRGLLTKAFGPAGLLREALSNVTGIERAFIYGSWAATDGTRRREPRDIDVMVLGRPEPDRLHEATSAVEDRVGRPVSVTLYAPEEWETDDSGFAEAVKGGPQITLIG